MQAAHVTCAADAGRGSRSVDLEGLRKSRSAAGGGDRPQPASAPPRRQVKSKRATPKQIQLSRDIIACESADAVLDLVTQASHLSVLNGVNASTALIRLARSAGKGAAWLQGDLRLAQLLSAAERLFVAMEARDVANTLYACGKLGLELPPDWLQRYWQAGESKLGEFKPQDFSVTLYACGQLGNTPPADWLELFWDASAPKLGEFKPQELSNTLYACGQLDIRPPADWLERYWSATRQRLEVGRFQRARLQQHDVCVRAAGHHAAGRPAATAFERV